MIITINLCGSLDPHAIESGGLLQQKALERLETVVGELAKEARGSGEDRANAGHVERGGACRQSRPDMADEINVRRRHQTIFISGPRGAGKTTFLRSYLKRLLDRTGSDPKVQPLAYLDPTLIETGEHLMVMLLTKLDRLVRACWSDHCDEERQRTYRTHLERMASGIQQLGNGHAVGKPTWNDAIAALQSGLEHAYGSQALEYHFHRLLDEAAKLAGVDAFIVAFDDVDTDTPQAHQVLELIRRYLTSTRLIILVTGDINLYSYLVSRKQYDKLGKLGKLGKRTGFPDLDNPLPGLVAELEQQYLLKLFPLPRRIELETLAQIAERDQVNLACDENDSADHPEICAHLDKILEERLSLATREVEGEVAVYRRFLIRQPIRTVLQLLSSQYSSDNNKGNLALQVAQGFVGALHRTGVNVEELREGHPNLMAANMLGLWHQHGELETGFYALPTGRDEGFNAAQLLYASVLTEQTGRKPSAALHYLLAAPAASLLLSRAINSRFDLAPEAVRKSLVDYLGLSKREDSRHLAAHFSAILVTPGQRPNLSAGVMRLARSRKGSPPNFVGNVRKEYDYKDNNDLEAYISLPHLISNSNDKIQSPLFRVACAISMHRVIISSGGLVDYLSVYSLVAAIDRLLQLDDKCKGKDIAEVMASLTAIQTYSTPMFGNENKGGEDDGGIGGMNEIPDPALADADIDAVVLYIEKWLKHCATASRKSNPGCSSLLLGKIWTRFYYSLSNAFEEGPKDSMLAGQLMERSVWCLLNAVLVEEARYRPKSDWRPSVLQNPRGKPDILVRNIKAVRVAGWLKLSNLPLTSMLITCPLIWSFISSPASRALRTELVTVFPAIANADFIAEFENEEKTDSRDWLMHLSLVRITGTTHPAKAVSETKRRPVIRGRTQDAGQSDDQGPLG